MMMMIEEGFSPEVLVFEVLGQVNLRFWLMDCDLVFRWHLRPYHVITNHLIYELSL